MRSLAFAMPILSGQAEAWRRFTQELLASRRSEYEASRHCLGIRKEVVWLTRVGRAEMALVYIEADNAQEVLPRLAASTHPFDRWFSRRLLELQGVDLAQRASWPASELVLAWESPSSRERQTKGGRRQSR